MELVKEYIIPTSSTTTSATADTDISWHDWSPDINWCQFSGDCLNDLQSIILPTKFGDCRALTTTTSRYPTPKTQNSSAGTLFVYPEAPIRNQFYEPVSTKELRLIHLLMAAAEAISGDLKSPHLARVILVRLNELLVQKDHCIASGIECIAAHFTNALHTLLDGPHDQSNQQPHFANEVLIAFQLLHDMSPFVSFGHLTANQAILEAVAGERRVHIVDYDIAEGVQWASLIQALASRTNTEEEANLLPQLKITAVATGSRGSASAAQEAGRRLSAFAASVNQPFSFRICRLDQTKRFQPSAVKVEKGEALVGNCVIDPAQLCSASSLSSFLTGAAALGARILTVVEEESRAAKMAFAGKFMDEVERYMAIWEALEAGFPMQRRVREMVERVILGPRISGAVFRAYGPREGGDAAAEGCAEWMAAVGFERVGLSSFNICQARLLLGLFNDGYRIEEDEPNKLSLSWKSRRLMSASVWGIPPPPSPSTSLAF